jgi:hypothetical protein
MVFKDLGFPASCLLVLDLSKVDCCCLLFGNSGFAWPQLNMFICLPSISILLSTNPTCTIPKKSHYESDIDQSKHPSSFTAKPGERIKINEYMDTAPPIIVYREHSQINTLSKASTNSKSQPYVKAAPSIFLLITNLAVKMIEVQRKPEGPLRVNSSNIVYEPLEELEG